MKQLRSCGILVLVLFVWHGVKACERDELQMVQIISLHGSFAPPFAYPEDPNPASVWTEGLEDLTMLGKFQSYALGVFLRNFYGDFITSDPRELEVISSSDKGTVKSAQSLVTAFYSPTPYWEVVANFSWQPIYIKYDTEDEKFLSNRICPAADAEHKRLLLSETGALVQTYQNLFYYWGIHSGMDLRSIADVEELFNVLKIESSHNLTIPEWSRNYWNELKYLHDISVSLKTKSRRLRRLRGGQLVDRTIRTMKEKASNDHDQRKVVLYSTHTFPTLSFLAAMDFGIVERPSPCTTVMVELYKQDSEYLVRYLYLNSTVPQKEPQDVYTLIVPGCTEFCPLNYIIQYTSDVVPQKWQQECLIV